MHHSMSYGKSKPTTTSDHILNRLNQRKVNIDQISINSAALQDHIMSSYNLGDLDPFKRKPASIRKPAYMSKNITRKKPPVGRALSNAGATIMRTDSASSRLKSGSKTRSQNRHSSSYSNYSHIDEEAKIPKKSNQVYKTKNLIEKLNTETYINIEK